MRQTVSLSLNGVRRQELTPKSLSPAANSRSTEISWGARHGVCHQKDRHAVMITDTSTRYKISALPMEWKDEDITTMQKDSR